MAKTYNIQIKLDAMIAEAEDDIREGKIHSKDNVKKIIDSWKY
jgi:hypothetical protein